ncbi:hypothetical protein TYRP_015749 [Tyrophagus putrescentiae]|nr:hypothetical protein TYRP_015749 [Tyrophagus putrescentiae]
MSYREYLREMMKMSSTPLYLIKCSVTCSFFKYAITPFYLIQK